LSLLGVLLAVLRGLLEGEVKLLGGFLDLLGRHGPDDASQNVELGESVLSGHGIGLLDISSDFPGDLLDSLDTFNLLGGLD